MVKDRTLLATGLSEDELHQLINADDSILHDPFLYDGMSELINRLHAVKIDQQENPKHILVIDTDYDTDGVMSAAVLSAALDVFNIVYRIYVPSMADGYGLSVKAVHEMKSKFEVNGLEITTILTADNGTNAVSGVDEANLQGIHVLVTDHHLGGNEYSNADVIVNPNKQLATGEPEPYPFKGNAGAAVAWKAMMAYAIRYEPEVKDLIYNLIVFAGIADVSDVMPIVDENHYMVKKAVDELRRLIHVSQLYDKNPFVTTPPYEDVMHTPYVQYNTVFYGLYDMITLLQKSKDDKRLAKNKKPIPLKPDEELISWYLSPMINAPRRVHATSQEAMYSLMAAQANNRYDNIESMIQMNVLKSDLRNDVLDNIQWDEFSNTAGNVLFVNAQHGISGLIAGQVAQRTGKASIVFALPTTLDKKIYNGHEFDERFDADELIIGSSARSTNAQPLNVIMARISEIRPDIIVGGGGHAAAAGYSIRYKYFDIFKTLFNNVAQQVEDDIRAEYQKLIDNNEILEPVQNEIVLSFYDGQDSPEHAQYNVIKNKDTFAHDIMQVNDFQNELKPFGKDFNAQTTFLLDIDPEKIQNPEYKLDLDFWQTLKFNIYGVEVLTFDVDLANEIKERIATQNHGIIRVHAKLTINNFRGNITPQLQVEP